MSIGGLPPIFANAIAPFSPLARQPVGEESKDSKNSSLKAIVKGSELARGENRETEKPMQQRVEAVDDGQADAEQQSSSRKPTPWLTEDGAARPGGIISESV